MKKLLTLAATGLVCAAGYAQDLGPVKYLAGTPIQSADQLQSGTYFISGISGSPTPLEGLLQSTGDDAPGYFSTLTSVPEGGITDKSYVYYLDVTTAADGSKTFTVKNLQSNKYFSYEGKDNSGGVHVGRFNVIPVEAGNSKIATYSLENNPTYDGAALNIPRFNWAITNAREEQTNATSYCHANDYNGRKRLSYWGEAGNPGTSTCAAIGLIPAEATVSFAEDRTAWVVKGCSEQNIAFYSDGGFNELKDGDPNTFWHSIWSVDNNNSHGSACPHYFVIDRGEGAASTPIDAFGYLPRQDSQSGRITSYKMFVLDNIDGIKTVDASDTPNVVGYITDNHASLNTFLEANTPVATGTFTNDTNFKQVILDNQQTGRYVLFVATGSASGANSTCAEFYLYHYAPAVNGTLTFKRSSDDANPVVVHTELEVSKIFPEYDGFTCRNTGTVSSNNTAAEYILNEGKSFYLFNERKSTYVRVNAAGDGLAQEKVENPGSEAEFKMIPWGRHGEFAIYYPAAGKFVGNIVDDQHTTPVVDFTTTPQKYYTGKQAAPDNYMSWIGNTLSKSGYDYFNDLGTWGVCGYSWNDAGSRWVIVTDLAKFKENWKLRQDLLAALPNYEAMLAVLGEEDTEGLKAWAENYDFGGDVNVAVTSENQAKIDKIMNITLRAEIEIAKRRGNKLATMDFITDAGKTAWTGAMAQLESAAATQETLDAVNAAHDELGKATVDALSMKLKSTHHDTDYLSANIGVAGADPLAPAPRRWAGGSECRTWTLQSANGTGFYLFNEYTNKYLKHYANGSNPTFVNDASAASVYLIRVIGYEEGAETFGLKTFDNGVPANVAYLRSDGTNAVQAGSAETNPSWTIETVEPDEAANENLAGAKSYYNQFAKGDGIGEYTVANQEAADAAAGVTTDAQIPDKRAAATTLFNARITLNMPKTGTYLTFKGANNENVALFYTTVTYNHNGYDKPILEKTNAGYSDAAAIMYYDGEHLLSYTTGYYLGLSSDGWPAFIGDADMATKGNTPVTLGIAPGSLLSLYQINYARPNDTNCGLHINTVVEEQDGNTITHLFGDRCSNTTAEKADLAMTTRNEDAHNWVITQVNELPVAIHADGYGSFIAPVAVSFNENSVYIGSVSNGVLTFSEQSAGEIVAPNTPVIVKGTQSTTVNATIHYDFVESDAPATLAAEESTSPLGGSHIAANHVAEANHLTYAKTGENATALDESIVKLNKVNDGSVIPVNTLLLTLPNDSELIDEGAATATINLKTNNNVTGISAIEFRNLDGTREIYDLQGRRVNKAANGVYIINGKKVLVK